MDEKSWDSSWFIPYFTIYIHPLWTSIGSISNLSQNHTPLSVSTSDTLAQAAMVPTSWMVFFLLLLTPPIHSSHNRLRDPFENVNRSYHRSASDLSKASHHSLNKTQTPLWSIRPCLIWPLAPSLILPVLILAFPHSGPSHWFPFYSQSSSTSWALCLPLCLSSRILFARLLIDIPVSHLFPVELSFY